MSLGEGSISLSKGEKWLEIRKQGVYKFTADGAKIAEMKTRWRPKNLADGASGLTKYEGMWMWIPFRVGKKGQQRLEAVW
jgi:hypothetical protein